MTNQQQSNIVADCPACGASVPLKETAKVGTKVDCPGCGERLEVVGLEPPELYYAYPEWEEEFEEDEDEAE